MVSNNNKSNNNHVCLSLTPQQMLEFIHTVYIAVLRDMNATHAMTIQRCGELNNMIARINNGTLTWAHFPQWLRSNEHGLNHLLEQF